MGGPLSALVADVYMCHLEDVILSSPFSSSVSFWSRYVDDILCIWTGTKVEIESFSSFLNNLRPSIEFTLEGGGNSIPFLDLLIRLVPVSSLLTPKFSIFRKETFTGVSIHSSSLHPRSHKMASVHSAVNRLIRIPMDKEDLELEIRNIEEIARLNNLDLNVRKFIRRKSLRFHLSENPDRPRGKPSKKKWIRLPYLGRPSETLAKELRRLDYSVGFYPVHTLSQLSRLKDPIPLTDQPGIYRYSCADCPSRYIGQTGRSLRKRLAEHRTDYNQLCSGKRSPQCLNISAIARHCFTKGHSFNTSGAELIHVCEKSARMNKLEETETLCELKRSGINLLNNLDATYVSPIIRHVLAIDQDESSLG